MYQPGGASEPDAGAVACRASDPAVKCSSTDRWSKFTPCVEELALMSTASPTVAASVVVIGNDSPYETSIRS